jgi:drug/metabolite transporter (DMT)-like permease
MSDTTATAIAVLAALAAAASFGVAAALQHRQARLTPDAGGVRLLARLAAHPLWLAGIALAGIAYGLQALALAFGPLALVAPIVATDLLFALPVAARWSRPLRARDWLGCVLAAGAMTGPAGHSAEVGVAP